MTSTTAVSFPRQHAATRRFTLGTPRNIAVSPDGERVVFLRSKGGNDPVLCLWEWNVGTATERLIVDPDDLPGSPSGLPAAERARRERARESADGIVSYSIDSNAIAAAFALGGSLFVVDLASGALKFIATEPGVFDPRIDPTGQRVAFVVGNALHLVERATESVTTVASEDDPLVSWGRADFIAAEEMGRSRGFWWSPDGQSLLVNRVSDAPVSRWWIADPANPDREPNEIRYPAAGTANPVVDLALFGLDGTRTAIEWRGDQDEFEYLNDVIWVADHSPLVVRQPRNQRVVSIARVPLAAESGVVKEIHRIADDTWVELIPGSPAWSTVGLLTVEDRKDLDRRVLCLDGQPISPAGLQVRSIAAVTDTHALVTGWTDPTEVHVFRITLSNTHEIHQLTDEPGVHSIVAAGGTSVTISSRPGEPATQFEVISDGNKQGSIENRSATPVIDANPTFLELGERRLVSAIFFPSDHDGSSPLPVLLDPYGGPHAQRVLKTHLPHLTTQWFANQGFAVLVVDNRGTPGRGPAFERAVWGDLAAPVLEDQLAALDSAAELYPFLDLGRVGIRGWSFGGYLAALAALRAPRRIHAAIAGAPVTTWKLYDTHYTERYLGHPAEFPDHYARTDLTAEAGLLERPLLLIHGLADDNVVAAHTLRLSSALLAAGRAHQVLPLSGVTHMTPQEIVAENLLHLQRDFLHEHLGAGASLPARLTVEPSGPADAGS